MDIRNRTVPYQLGDQKEMRNIWNHKEIICVSEHVD